MPDVQAFLTRKAGPLPVWAWAAIVGGGAGVLYLRGKGQSATPAATGAQATDGSSGQGIFAPSPIIVTPGNMPASISSANPPPAPGTTLTTVTLSGGDARGVPIWSANVQAQGVIGYAPAGTVLPMIGPAPGFHGPEPGYLVRWAGQTGWVSGTNVSSAGMGGGGTSSAVKTLPGAGKVGRFSSRHAHPQFLGVGMGGGGRAGLRAVSKRTGLPEARLMALNPGHWKPTPGGQPRHIHIR